MNRKLSQLMCTCMLLALLIELSPGPAHAQLDTIHYIPPFYSEYTEYTAIEQKLFLSTPSTTPVTVTVKDGAGTILWSGTVSNTVPTSIIVNDNVLSNHDLLNQVTTAGLVVTADEPVYANIRHAAGPQGGSATAKGLAALGTRFRAGVMRDINTTTEYRALFIAVMATEDDTTVNFGEIKPGVVFYGTSPSGSPLTTDPISMTLHANESYVIGIHASEYIGTGGTAPFNDVNGTLITSDKPIAVNSGTWLGGPGTSQDMGIDQIVPESRLALEYILMQGNGGDGDLETPVVVATADNTEIYVNDSGTPFTTLQAGDYVFLDGQYSADGNMRVQATQPIYIYQTMAGSISYATPGMNCIPPVDTTSPAFVNNIPNVNYLGSATINILARSGAWVNVNGSPIEVSPAPVPGTADWVTYRVPDLTGHISVESGSAIAVQFTNLSGYVGAAGYYAGFPLVSRDFGDLPAAYKLTTSADNGASHATSTLILGAAIDGETDGQESADVDGDDSNDSDDEDGVLITSAWVKGSDGGRVDVTVTGGSGCLSAWLDWNGNNSFGDSGDQIIEMAAVTSDVNHLSFDVPTGVLLVPETYKRFARFRLAPDKGTAGDCNDDPALALTGLVAGGEVEDHALEFTLTNDLLISKTQFEDGNDGFVTPGETISYTITVENFFHNLMSLMVFDQLSDLVTYQSGFAQVNDAAQENLLASGNLLTYSPDAFGLNDILTITFNVVVNLGGELGKEIVNSASVEYVLQGISDPFTKTSDPVQVYIEAEVIPEPATLLLLGSGLLGLLGLERWKKVRK